MSLCPVITEQSCHLELFTSLFTVTTGKKLFLGGGFPPFTCICVDLPFCYKLPSLSKHSKHVLLLKVPVNIYDYNFPLRLSNIVYFYHPESSICIIQAFKMFCPIVVFPTNTLYCKQCQQKLH